MTIEYYLNHVSHSHLLMSSRIKHIIDSFFFSLTVIAIFFCKNHMWSERLRLLLQSFLKLKSFYYNNYNGYFIDPHQLRQGFITYYITGVQFFKSFFHAACEICLVKKFLKLQKFNIVNDIRDEHEKHIVSDSMFKHNDHYLHPAAFHCVNNSESTICRLDFLELRGR